MVLAILCDRGFKNPDLWLEGVVQVVEQTHKLPVTVVSEGSSNMVKKWTKDNKIRHRMLRAKYNENGSKQSQVDLIAKTATHALIFSGSKANKNAEKIAKRMRKDGKLVVEIVDPDL